MRFALCQVLQRLMSRKGRGILEMLQLILSFFLMTCCLNLFLSTSALGAREDISDHTVSRIQWTQRTSGGLLQNGYAGFSRDDYEAVRTVSSAKLVYATWYSTLVQPSARTENIKEIFLIFAPCDSLPLLGEITLADADMPIYHASAVGLSAEAADALAQAQTAGECYALNPGSIAQNLLRNGYAREDIALTNVFAVPMEYMADFDAADTLGVYLTADFASADAQAIVCLLYQHHPTGIEYCVLPMNSRMTVSLDRASDQARDFMMYAAILLAAVSIGLIGSMLTRWSKRKKEYAVLRCLGVPETTLAFESVMEMVIPFLLSGVIGAGLGAAASPHITVGEVAVHGSIQAIAVPILFAAVAGALLSLILLHQQRHVVLAAVLRYNE